MTNWIFSFITGSIIFLLSFFIFREAGVSSNVVPALLALVVWLCFGFLLNNDKEPYDELVETTSNVEVEVEAENVSCVAPSDLKQETPSSLQDAVLELAKQLRSKEKELDQMHAKVSEREFRRSISRLASINETLCFTLKLLEENRLSPSDAVEQLRAEIASAVSDLGIDVYSITPGVAVSSLPQGSFVIIKALDNAPVGMAGTVKDVISQGLFVSDEKEKLHFISPSKITVYKL